MYSATKLQPAAGPGDGSVLTQNHPAWFVSSSPVHSSSSSTCASCSSKTTWPRSTAHRLAAGRQHLADPGSVPALLEEDGEPDRRLEQDHQRAHLDQRRDR